MSKRTTTIYVDLASENAGLSFDVLTHRGDPETLEKGIHLAANFGESAFAVVDTAKAQGLMSQFNHAPGCQVRGYETH